GKNRRLHEVSPRQLRDDSRRAEKAGTRSRLQGLRELCAARAGRLGRRARDALRQLRASARLQRGDGREVEGERGKVLQDERPGEAAGALVAAPPDARHRWEPIHPRSDAETAAVAASPSSALAPLAAELDIVGPLRPAAFHERGYLLLRWRHGGPV